MMKLPKIHTTQYGLERAITNYIAMGHAVSIFASDYEIALDGGEPIKYAEAYAIMRKVVEQMPD